MQKARLRHAYRLISENREDEARRILNATDDPTATVWLARLDRGGPFPPPAEYLIGTDKDDAFLEGWVRAERWIAALSGLVVIGLGVIVLSDSGILGLKEEQIKSQASQLIMQLCPWWIALVGLFLLSQAIRPDTIRRGLLTMHPLLERIGTIAYLVVGGILLSESDNLVTYTLSAIFLLRGLYHGWRLWQIKRFDNKRE